MFSIESQYLAMLFSNRYCAHRQYRDNDRLKLVNKSPFGNYKVRYIYYIVYNILDYAHYEDIVGQLPSNKLNKCSRIVNNISIIIMIIYIVQIMRSAEEVCLVFVIVW